MPEISTPKRILLDTNHLIEICRHRSGASGERPRETARLSALLQTGHITACLTQGHAQEWSRKRVGNAIEIATYLDGMPNQALFIQTHQTLFRYEILAEVARHQAIELPRGLRVLRKVGEPDLITNFILERSPELLRRLSKKAGLDEQATERVVTTVGPSCFRTVREMVECQSATHQMLGVDGPDVNEFLDFCGLYKAKRLLPHSDKWVVAHWVQVMVDEQLLSPEVRAVLDRLELVRCPGLRLWAQVLWHYVRRENQPCSNDYYDLSLVPAIAYVDYALTERGLRGLVNQADSSMAKKVFYRASDLVAAIS